MKVIKQISTGNIVFRENPYTTKTLGNAEFFTKIQMNDLQVVDESYTDQEYMDQLELQKPYDERRRKSYPPMTDYLDGIVKNDKKQINQYISDCLAVKARYPK